MTDKTSVEIDASMEDLKGSIEPIKDTPVAPAHGIAAIALNMALKYHDITIIKDGAMYQQYKLEGRNIENLHLDAVFETAIRMERHLLGASDRIAALIMDAIIVPEEDGEASAESGDRTEADANSVVR